MSAYKLMSFGLWLPIPYPRCELIDVISHTCHTYCPSILAHQDAAVLDPTVCSQNDDLDFLHSDVQYLSSSGPTVPPGLESGQTAIAIVHARPPSPSPAFARHHYRLHSPAICPPSPSPTTPAGHWQAFHYLLESNKVVLVFACC